jgi:phage replication-related protein YjqB (UPF0714/DUF867 family)
MSPRNCSNSADNAAAGRTDPYQSFFELNANERSGLDFQIRTRRGPTGILVLAPHGGNIEPGSSEIADACAAEEHSLYAFEGLKPRGNWRLHIASIKFDEPTCRQLLRQSSTAIVIHGCRQPDDRVYLGGLDAALAERIGRFLQDAGFSTGSKDGIQGRSPRNICNLCGNGRGVQLEVPFALRCRMFAHLKADGRRQTTDVFARFVQCVREALG